MPERSLGLYLSVGELATDQTLRVKDGVVGVHRDLVLRGIADQPLGVGEGDVGWSCAVTLVVGDDLNTIVLPDTDTAKFTMSTTSSAHSALKTYE